MFTPGDGDPNLSSDQFGSTNKANPDHAEQITYQYPLSRYHTGHPIDQALGYKDIAHGIGQKLAAEKVGAEGILNGVRAVQGGHHG